MGQRAKWKYNDDTRFRDTPPSKPLVCTVCEAEEVSMFPIIVNEAGFVLWVYRCEQHTPATSLLLPGPAPISEPGT